MYEAASWSARARLRTDGVVGSVGGVVFRAGAAQREDLQARETGLRAVDVFAFEAGDLGDGAQHYTGGDGQLGSERRETEESAQGAGHAGGQLVEGFVSRGGLLPERFHRDVETLLNRGVRGFLDHLATTGRQAP